MRGKSHITINESLVRTTQALAPALRGTWTQEMKKNRSRGQNANFGKEPNKQIHEKTTKSNYHKSTKHCQVCDKKNTGGGKGAN